MINKRIVLIHGWGANIEKLQPLKNVLEQTGWEVLVPELPGFDANDPEEPLTLNEYADYVMWKIKNRWADNSCYLFGHSFGGRVALKIAMKKEIELNGIILCATGGISRGSFLKRSIFLAMSKIGKIFLLFPPLANIFRKIIYKLAREHDYEKSNDVMKKTMQNIIEEDLKEKVTKIKMKTLILWGKEDRITPYKDALYLDKSMSNSTLVSFSDQGHTLPYELPSKLAEEIDKWTR